MARRAGKGTFVYDFGGQQVILKDIESTMPPVDVMMWIDPKIAETIKPYRFRQPPRVEAEGVVDLKVPPQRMTCTWRFSRRAALTTICSSEPSSSAGHWRMSTSPAPK